VRAGYVARDLTVYTRTFVLTDMPLILTWAVAVAVQFTLAYYLHNAVVAVDGDLGVDCNGTDSVLRYLGLSAFVAFGMADLLETWDIHLWLAQFQTVGKFGTLRFKRYRDTDADEEAASTPLQMSSLERATSAYVEGSSKTARVSHVVTQPVTGITCITKIYFYVTAVATKALANLFVLMAGSGAVLRSDNNFDLILNSVAASFILDIDNQLYHLLVPGTMKRSWSFLPPIGIPKSSVASITRIGTPLYVYVSFAVLVALDFMLADLVWCTDLVPNTPFTYWFNTTRSLINQGIG